MKFTIEFEGNDILKFLDSICNAFGDEKVLTMVADFMSNVANRVQTEIAKDTNLTEETEKLVKQIIEAQVFADEEHALKAIEHMNALISVTGNATVVEYLEYLGDGELIDDKTREVLAKYGWNQKLIPNDILVDGIGLAAGYIINPKTCIRLGKD